MDTKELFLNFIKEEELELKNNDDKLTIGQKASFYWDNYFVLNREFKKAAKLLNTEELRHFYLHYSRKNIAPIKEIEKTYSLWEDAYKKNLFYMDIKQYHYTYTKWNRLEGLALFGYDNKTKIGQNKDFEDYSIHAKMYTKVHSYINIPGMIKKVNYFYEFAQNEKIVNRISQTLVNLGFVQDIYWEKLQGTDKEEIYAQNYSYVNLTFWAFVFILLNSKSEIARNTILQFKSYNQLPKFIDQMEILTRLEEAANKYKKTVQ